jgi:hypothetical protein
MSYIRITIHLKGGARRTGVRHFPTDIALRDIQAHAWQLSVEALGREAIAHLDVEKLPSEHSAVVAYICRSQGLSRNPVRSSGEHPFLSDQKRRPPR